MSEQLPFCIGYVKTEPLAIDAEVDSADSNCWSANTETMNREFSFSIDNIKTEPAVMAVDQYSPDNYMRNMTDIVENLYNYPSSSITSRVWKYFMFRKKDGVDGPPTRENLNMDYTICTLCRREYKFKGNTTNMQTHLRHSHLDILQGDEQPSTSDQRVVNTFVNKSVVPPPKPVLSHSKQAYTQCHDTLMKLLVSKCLPVSLVEDENFREYTTSLDPKYEIPSEETMSKWLACKEKSVAMYLKNELTSLTDVAMTYDSWTNVTKDSFICVTAHFITQDWNLREVALQVFKQESGNTVENTSEILQVCKNYWVPGGKIIGVCDSSSDENKAYVRLNWSTFECFGHKLNKMVTQALCCCSEINHLVAKGRKLVTFCHQSPAVTNMLHSKQKVLFPEGDRRWHCDLIQDCMKKWNSTFEMLQILTEQRPALMAVVMDEELHKGVKDNLKNCVFSFDEQNAAERVVILLESFNKATLSLCAEQVPTMQKVLPVILKLQRVLRLDPGDPVVVTEMKKTLRGELQSRDEDYDILLMAAVLNPFTKGLAFLPEEQRKKTRQMLKEEVKVVVRENMKAKSDGDSTEPHSKKLKKSSASCADLDDWMNDILSEVSADENPHSQSSDSSEDAAEAFCKAKADSEVNQYLAEIMPDGKNVAILHWWRDTSTKYPNVSKLVQKYLAIPASSISSERVFSLTENISEKRARLSSENTNTFVFLDKNMKYYW